MTNTKSPLKEAKWVTSRGLVKISASYLFVSMYFISISPFSIWSPRKWCLTCMCFSLPWKIGFGLSIWHWNYHTWGKHSCGHSVISYGMQYPKNLGATAGSSYKLGLCGWLCNWSLFARRPTNEKIQESEIYQKCFFYQFYTRQNQHRKTQQDQAMKKRSTKSQIRVCIWDT
jgi:hypothetical protein